MATAAKRTPTKHASPAAQDTFENGAAPTGGTTLAPLPKNGSGVALSSPLMERLREQAKDQAAKERPSISKISLRGGVLEYQNQVVANNTLPCVILASVHRNTYYDKPFDPDNLANPVCFSLAEDDEGMTAHKNVPDANVGPDSEEKDRETPRSCTGCAFNDWGSDPKPNSKGKACKETRRIVVMPSSALESAETVAKAEIAIIDIPVTSGKNYSNFVNSLAASTGLPPWAAVTEITAERDPRTQFKVLFTPVSAVADEEVLLALEARKEQAVQLALTPYDEVASTKEGKMQDAPPKKVVKKKF